MLRQQQSLKLHPLAAAIKPTATITAGNVLDMMQAGIHIDIDFNPSPYPLAPQTPTHSYMLVLDLSASMADSHLNTVKRALAKVLDELPLGGTTLSLLTFADRATVRMRNVVISARNLVDVKRAVNTLSANNAENGGGTDFKRIPNAVGLDECAFPVTGGTVIFVTDGKFNELPEGHTKEQIFYGVRENLSRILCPQNPAAVSIVPIGIGKTSDLTYLQTLSSLPNGYYHEVDYKGDVTNVVDGNSLSDILKKHMRLVKPVQRPVEEVTVCVGISTSAGGGLNDAMQITSMQLNGMINEEGRLVLGHVFPMPRMNPNSQLDVLVTVHKRQGKGLELGPLLYQYSEVMSYARLCNDNALLGVTPTFQRASDLMSQIRKLGYFVSQLPAQSLTVVTSHAQLAGFTAVVQASMANIRELLPDQQHSDPAKQFVNDLATAVLPDCNGGHWSTAGRSVWGGKKTPTTIVLLRDELKTVNWTSGLEAFRVHAVKLLKILINEQNNPNVGRSNESKRFYNEQISRGLRALGYESLEGFCTQYMPDTFHLNEHQFISTVGMRAVS